MEHLTLEQRFHVLCLIARAQHFAWRQAVQEVCPDVDPTKVVDAMWRITGEQTAQAYVKHVDHSQPVEMQVAESLVWSSRCMGEDAAATLEADGAYVRHQACPWYDWHSRLGLLAEDRPGCDQWFRTTVQAVGRALGTPLRVETLKSLPDGDDCCLRRIQPAEQP